MNDWIGNHPYKMALILSIVSVLIYSTIYFSSFGTEKLDGLIFAVPFLFVSHFCVAKFFNWTERGKN